MHNVATSRRTDAHVFMRAIATVSGPSAIGAAVGFASTPLFATWYRPSDFGDLGYALAVASILSSMVSLRLEVLIYRLAPEERDSTAWQAMLVSIATATTLMAVALAAMPWLIGSIVTPRLVIVTWAMTVAICMANIGTAHAVVSGRLRLAGLPRAVAPLVTLGIATILRVADLPMNGTLVLATLSGLLIAAVQYVRPFAHYRRGAIQGAVGLVRAHWRYICFAAPQNSVANAAFLNSAILLVGYLYGDIAAGLVFFAFRIVGFPSTALGVAAGHLLSSEMQVSSRQWLARRMRQLCVAGCVIYLPLLVLSLLVAPTLIPPHWRGALEMVVPVMILCAVHFCIGSLGQLMLVWNRAGLLLAWDSVRLVATVITLLLAYAAGASAVGAVAAFVAAQMPFYALLALLLWRVVPHVMDGQPEASS